MFFSVRRNAQPVGIVLKVLIGSVLVALVMGCSTIPAPKSGAETLLVIPVVREDAGGAIPSAGYFEILLGGEGRTLPARWVRIDGTRPFTVVDGLEPGRYTIRQTRAVGTGDNVVMEMPRVGQRRETGVAVEVEAGAITISPIAFRLRTAQRTPGTFTFRLSTEETTPSLRRTVLDELSEDPDFAAWDVRGQ
ncbi:MAG: hypothetical protein ACOCYC_04670 [bacterium]